MNYKNVLIEPFVTEHAKRAKLVFKIILSFMGKLRFWSILAKTFLAVIQIKVLDFTQNTEN